MVVANLSQFLDFKSPKWNALFVESSHQYIPSDEMMKSRKFRPPTEAEQARETRLDDMSWTCSTVLLFPSMFPHLQLFW
jgi:hypothetical protein